MKIVRQEDIKKWEASQRVSGKVLLSGDRITLLFIEMEPGGIIHEHSHPHEQMGLCLQGKARFEGGGETRIVKAGMAYFFPSNEKHGVKLVGDEPGIFLEIFSPPREDHVEKQRKADNESNRATRNKHVTA